MSQDIPGGHQLKKMGYDVRLITDSLGYPDLSITKTYLDGFGNEELDKASERISKLEHPEYDSGNTTDQVKLQE